MTRAGASDAAGGDALQPVNDKKPTSSAATPHLGGEDRHADRLVALSTVSIFELVDAEANTATWPSLASPDWAPVQSAPFAAQFHHAAAGQPGPINADGRLFV